MLIFFEKKELKFLQKKSLITTEFYEKCVKKKIVVDFFVVIEFKIKSL
jgi:hypothetical protein